MQFGARAGCACGRGAGLGPGRPIAGLLSTPLIVPIVPQTSASGQAEIRNFVTILEARIDLRSTAPGEYQLALRRPGEDWHLYPARVK